MGRRDGVVEVVLQAVQVEVDDCDLAVELRVERDGRVGRRRVHDLCDGRRHVWPQPALVDPGVHLGALLLQLVDPGLHVLQLSLELLDLLGVRPHRLVEGVGQQVGHGLGLAAAEGRRRLAHGLRQVGAGVGGACVLRLLGLLRARVHGAVVVGRAGERLLVLLAAAVGAAVVVVV